MKNKTFKERFTYQDRKNKFNKFKEIYPDRIPVVLQPEQRYKNGSLNPMKKSFYLFGENVSVCKILQFIRSEIKIGDETAIWLFVNGIVPQMTSTLNSLYENNKDNDGFLYIVYCGELTFGNSTVIHKL